MPAGLRVWNADGSLQFDSASRLFRVLTLVDTGGSNGSTSVSPQGTVIPVVQPSNVNNVQPVVSVSGGTVSWTFSGSGTNDNASIVVMEY
jgi:hypothetical protein